MRLPRVLVGAAVLGLGFVVVANAPAGADCSGPMISWSPDRADRGGELTITGSGMGDNCYDTGAPPSGEGLLGNPQQDVQVMIVQGDREYVVGQGDADDEYRFEITAVVPAALEPGPATVRARLASGADAYVDPTSTLEITATPAPAEEDDGPGVPLVSIGAVLIVVAVAACVRYPMRQARRRREG